jgi:uncharacterized protein (TIGR03067 family)
MHAGIALLSCLLAVAADDKANAKKDEEALAGKWRVVSTTIGGETIPTGKDSSEIYSFAGKGKLTRKTSVGRIEMPTVESAYKIDATKNPPEIDIDAVVNGKPQNLASIGIYSMKGDELKLCLRQIPDGGPRPKEFATKKGDDLVLIVLKRIK